MGKPNTILYRLHRNCFYLNTGPAFIVHKVVSKFNRIMHHYIILFLFIACFTFCTPVRVVSTQQKPGVDFKSYQTYNFLDISLKNDSMVEVAGDGMALLKSAIDEQMQKRGYTKSARPDLWVNIGIVTEQKVQTRQTNFREAPRYIGQRRYSWKSQEVVVNTYEQGTVSVDIVDNKLNERVWEGVAQGTIPDNPSKLNKRIRKAMEKLFGKYPVNPV
jgi:hypothetical protein